MTQAKINEKYKKKLSTASTTKGNALSNSVVS